MSFPYIVVAISVVVESGGMTGTKAVNSLVFAEYFNRILWNATRGDDAPAEIIPSWVINATAVAAVCFVVMLVVGTRSLGTRAAVILTIMKVSSKHAARMNLTNHIPLRSLR